MKGKKKKHRKGRISEVFSEASLLGSGSPTLPKVKFIYAGGRKNLRTLRKLTSCKACFSLDRRRIHVLFKLILHKPVMEDMSCKYRPLCFQIACKIGIEDGFCLSPMQGQKTTQIVRPSVYIDATVNALVDAITSYIFEITNLSPEEVMKVSEDDDKCPRELSRYKLNQRRENMLDNDLISDSPNTLKS
ncbi:hypothetical protein VNO77_31404 [Canavalia gladiata]|uniref:Uncharacterized protein n=1 Tax=Canavalia gladiata TaxID=3824 RepID=A0AAN9Q3N6_CANGL